MKSNIEKYNEKMRALTTEEAHELAVANGRAGGLASGIARQRRKQMREIISDALSLPVVDEEMRAVLERAGLTNSNDAAVAFSMIQRAQRGDVDAARFIRDTIGEKPRESIELSPILDPTIPVDRFDLSKLSDEELKAMIVARSGADDPALLSAYGE